MKATNQTKLKETEIGFIPKEWEVLSVGSVAHINERVIPRNDQIESIQYLDTASVENGIINNFQSLKLSLAPSRAKRILRDGDTIISTVRPNLKHFAFIKDASENWIGSTGFAVVTPKKVDPRFLYFSLTSDSVTEYLSSIAASQTSTYPAFNPDVLKELLIALPLEKEQKQIAEILSSLDDKIELNRKINANLEKLASSLFKKWFVDIGDELPEGWKVTELKNILELNYGKALKAEDRNTGKIKVYGSSGIVGFNDKKLVDGPGIIIGRKGNVGSVFWSDDDFYAIDTTYFVKSNLPLTYCHYLLKNQTFVNSDSVVPGLNRDQAYRTEVILPSSDVLEKFNVIASDLIKSIAIIDRETKNLEQIRDSLLPRLMSGTIRIEI